jgi:hypothetical protein
LHVEVPAGEGGHKRVDRREIARLEVRAVEDERGDRCPGPRVRVRETAGTRDGNG